MRRQINKLGAEAAAKAPKESTHQKSDDRQLVLQFKQIETVCSNMAVDNSGYQFSIGEQSSELVQITTTSAAILKQLLQLLTRDGQRKRQRVSGRSPPKSTRQIDGQNIAIPRSMRRRLRWRKQKFNDPAQRHLNLHCWIRESLGVEGSSPAVV